MRSLTWHRWAIIILFLEVIGTNLFYDYKYKIFFFEKKEKPKVAPFNWGPYYIPEGFSWGDVDLDFYYDTLKISAPGDQGDMKKVMRPFFEKDITVIFQDRAYTLSPKHILSDGPRAEIEWHGIPLPPIGLPSLEDAEIYIDPI